MILVVYFSFILYFCSKSHCIVNTKEIGIIIKKRRQHLKVRQQELADLSGVGINTLVAIERGQENFSVLITDRNIWTQIRRWIISKMKFSIGQGIQSWKHYLLSLIP